MMTPVPVKEMWVEARPVPDDLQDDIPSTRYVYAVCPFSGLHCLAAIIKGSTRQASIQSIQIQSGSRYLKHIRIDDDDDTVYFVFCKPLATTAALRQPGIPAPPVLLEAIDFKTTARLVGGWWEPSGDELTMSDGQQTTVGGCNWQAWLLYIRHPAVAPYIEGYDLGSSESPARHALLWDTRKQCAFAGERLMVEAVLADQWYGPADEVTIITAAGLEAADHAADELLADIKTAFFQSVVIDEEQIRRQMVREEQNLARLKQALDARLHQLN